MIANEFHQGSIHGRSPSVQRGLCCAVHPASHSIRRLTPWRAESLVTKVNAKKKLQPPDHKLHQAFKTIIILLTALIMETVVLARFWYTTRHPAGTVGPPVATENAVARAYPRVDFTKFYSGLSAGEIDELQRACLSVRNIYSPFMGFRPQAVTNRYVTVYGPGFRRGREPQPWPPLKSDFVVFVFGGSTTWGFGVRDSETPVAALEQELASRLPGRKVQCYNFAACYYFSTQERLLFETLLQSGVVPDLAIFIDGLNDFHYGSGQPEFTDQLSKCLAPDLQSRTVNMLSTDAERGVVVDDIVRRYAGNVRMAKAVADAYGVKTIFIGQPVPFFDYPVPPEKSPFQERMADHWLCGWGYRRFEAAAQKGEFGSNFVWCGDAFLNTTAPMYVDSTHYSQTGAVLLARTIATRISGRQFLPVVGAR